MSEINIKLGNIRAVRVQAKVVYEKDTDPRIVTKVSFEYDGEPSKAESILLLEEQGQCIDAIFETPQLSLGLARQ